MKLAQTALLGTLLAEEGTRVEKLAELIVPDIDAEQIGLPLEKIGAGLTGLFIQGALDSYLQLRTLQDLAEDTKYPIKKLRSILGLEIGKTGYEKPLRDFGISAQRINRAIRIYEEGETDFLWSIIATGMIIVFAALIITGLVVALLEYFHRLGNKRIRRKTSTKSVTETTTDTTARELRRKRRKRTETSRTADDELDAHTIVAIATAIRLHESSMEEANRILATWTKASVSTWKASRMMPNRRFFDKRRG